MLLLELKRDAELMPFELVDIVGWEDPHLITFPVAEGHSKGTAVTVRDSDVDGPAPWPASERYTLRCLQHASQSWWQGKSYAMSAGFVWRTSFYYHPVRTGWPCTNDMPIFRLVTAGLATHIKLNVTANGVAADVQIIDAGLSVVGTIADGFPNENTTYRIDILVKIHNSNGACEIRIVDKFDDSVTGSISLSSQDFYGGADTILMYFQGETGTTPITAVATYFGSAILFGSDITTIDTDDFMEDYTIFGTQPDDNTGVVPDCDEDGVDPGSKDNLDFGTWDHLADGSSSSICRYNNRLDEGAIKVGFPAGDARILGDDAVRYGTSWFGYAAGNSEVDNIRILFGREDDSGSGYTIANVDVPESADPFKIVRDSVVYPTLEADLDKEQMLGFKNISGFGLGSAVYTWLREAWVMSAFVYPPGTVSVVPLNRGLRAGMLELDGGKQRCK